MRLKLSSLSMTASQVPARPNFLIGVGSKSMGSMLLEDELGRLCRIVMVGAGVLTVVLVGFVWVIRSPSLPWTVSSNSVGSAGRVLGAQDSVVVTVVDGGCKEALGSITVVTYAVVWEVLLTVCCAIEAVGKHGHSVQNSSHCGRTRGVFAVLVVAEKNSSSAARLSVSAGLSKYVVVLLGHGQFCRDGFVMFQSIGQDCFIVLIASSISLSVDL